ncbi:unnamed protein product [Rotaria magnacalcarata]|uniref:Helix-turn-helix domain-containing protein n=2 Tax=Rotaria magnacalcarata TaxID=392030 RepID=A0A8S2NBD4_9BILA|nr:unnamed protein product [Rotaria magnacalcarata]
MKLYSTKSKNYLAETKRVEYDLPPKFISNIDFTFKIDESIFSKDEVQALYNQMRHITKEYRIDAMSLYVQSTNREREIFTDEIKHIIEGFPRNTEENDEQVDAESGYIEFKHYNELREKRLNLEVEQSIYFLEEEYEFIKLGPRFIYNDPKTASRRHATELTILKRKIELRFFEKKVSPGQSVEFFIAELNIILQKLHDASITSKHRQKKQQHKLFLSDNPLATTQSSQSQNINSSSSFRNEKKKNYGRLVKRLKHKIRSVSLVLQKTDKSKVFHLGTRQHYQKKSNEYMEKIEAYRCLGVNNPLPNLIERTNKYLLDLRLAHWITQKQYELLCVKPSEAKLAHLYYLPKTHKPGTSLHPIVSGLKHPNIKISTYLNQLLRPLFDKIALKTTATSRFEVMKQEGQYYHQIRGGAMGSPLTLTIANCYMFFFERNTVKQITNAGENIDADLFTKVYHKPSYEPYYLPFNSVHPLHMKKNIPFAMFLRAIRYCSTFKAFLDEREDLRMALLLNKYPGKFIDNQFNRVLKKCNITQSLTSNNYNTIRKNIIYNIIEEEKIPTDHYRTMFIHFTYCLNIRTLPTKFHTLWNKYFSESPINEIIPVIGTRNVQNLQKQLVKNK